MPASGAIRSLRPTPSTSCSRQLCCTSKCKSIVDSSSLAFCAPGSWWRPAGRRCRSRRSGTRSAPPDSGVPWLQSANVPASETLVCACARFVLPAQTLPWHACDGNTHKRSQQQDNKAGVFPPSSTMACMSACCATFTNMLLVMMLRPLSPTICTHQESH